MEGADSLQEGLVGGRAAHEDVLAVIGATAGFFVEVGVGGAARPGAPFEELDRVAASGELAAGGEPGETGADDADAHVPALPRSGGAAQGGVAPEACDCGGLLAAAEADALGEDIVVARFDAFEQFEVHALEDVHAHA